MRIDNHRRRPIVLPATAAMLAIAVVLIWGTGVSLARGINATKYYEDEEENVCVGLVEAGGFGSKSCEWGALSGKNNVGLGEKVMERSTGSENVGVGFDALAENEAGTGNTATGFFALLHNHNGSDNTATGRDANYRCSGEECKRNTETGSSALRNNASGSGNAAFGYQALDWAEGISGNENVGIGYKAGSALSGGSNNVDISNQGAAGDEKTTRVGTEGAQTRAFVAGVYPVSPPPGSKTCTVKVTEQGQLVCSETKGLKICVPEKGGKPITTPPCKKGYKEEEVAKL